MKLKPIPNNTVVHTPTKDEAKELLSILHENGYKLWNGRNLLELSDGFAHRMKAVAIRPNQGVVDWYGNIANAPESITLAEFKRLYCEEDKPQPKFKVGDRVNVVGYQKVCVTMSQYVGKVGTIMRVSESKKYYQITCDNRSFWWRTDWLAPSETKPTEEMEENKEINKELNLCELLKGHEGETFFHLMYGECVLEDIDPHAKYSICLKDKTNKWVVLPFCGHMPGGLVILYPSRALYEQYPLDAKKAWKVWRDEQEKYHNEVIVNNHDCNGDLIDCAFVSGDKVLRTHADRDRCISEIKAIIEKYSKK